MNRVYSVDSLIEEGYFVADDVAWKINDTLRNGNVVFRGGVDGEFVVGVFETGEEFEIGRIKRKKEMGVYLIDQETIISEAFDSVEELLEEIGTHYNFIDVLIDNEKKRLFKGTDY